MQKCLSQSLGYEHDLWVLPHDINMIFSLKYDWYFFFSLGIGGCGKCNHVGGLLFPINSFTAHGLHTNQEKIFCTSKINGWILPRNLAVKPKDISEIKISQQKLAGNVRMHNENSLYDPRVPVHRNTKVNAFNSLYQKE